MSEQHDTQEKQCKEETQEHLRPSFVRGITDNIVGAVKESVGYVFGNSNMESEGKDRKEHGATELGAASQSDLNNPLNAVADVSKFQNEQLERDIAKGPVTQPFADANQRADLLRQETNENIGTLNPEAANKPRDDTRATKDSDVTQSSTSQEQVLNENA